jgi:hypothetical protein
LPAYSLIKTRLGHFGNIITTFKNEEGVYHKHLRGSPALLAWRASGWCLWCPSFHSFELLMEGTKEGDPGFELRSFGVILQEQTGMMKTGESCQSRPDTSVPMVTPMWQTGVKFSPDHQVDDDLGMSVLAK